METKQCIGRERSSVIQITSNVMLRLVWLFLHLAATIVHFTLATTYTLQCYVISTGLLNKYKALDLTKLQCLAIVIESQEANDTSRVVTLLRWLSDVGVKYICLYDMDGVLKRSKYTILEDLGDKSHLEGDEKGSSLDQTHTSLEFISFSDGKEGIAKAADFLYTNYKEISDIGEQDKAIFTEADMAKALTAVGCGGPQPNLLLVYGPVRCHLGFPAWRLKYTEIVHMGTLKSMKHGAVLKALHQFMKVQQNFGSSKNNKIKAYILASM